MIPKRCKRQAAEQSSSRSTSLKTSEHGARSWTVAAGTSGPESAGELRQFPRPAESLTQPRELLQTLRKAHNFVVRSSARRPRRRARGAARGCGRWPAQRTSVGVGRPRAPPSPVARVSPRRPPPRETEARVRPLGSALSETPRPDTLKSTIRGGPPRRAAPRRSTRASRTSAGLAAEGSASRWGRLCWRLG